MRIALFHSLPSGGAKRFVYEEARLLSRRGHEIVEFTTTAANEDFFSLGPLVNERHVYEFSPLPLYPGRVPFVTPYVHLAQTLATLLRARHVNRRIAVHMSSGGFDLALVEECTIMPTPYVLRDLRIPSVFQCHDVRRQISRLRPKASVVDGEPFSARLKRLYYAPKWFVSDYVFAQHERRNLRCASRVLTNSRYSQRTLQQRYGIEAHVVYPGIDVQTFRPRRIEKHDMVLAVGALHYMKGYRFLVSAIGLIPPQRRPLLFIAANSAEPAEEAAVRQRASELGVALEIENVRDDARMVQLYNQAQVFVYAPMQEALGMAPLEAMACGIPVLAVGEGGVSETVVNGETGWLVQRDARAFADRLDALLAHPDVRVQMGSRGVEYVRSHWTWQRAVDELERHLVVGATCDAH